MDGRLKHLLSATCASPEKIKRKSEELLRLSELHVNGGVLGDPLLRACLCVDIAAELNGQSIEKSKLAQACGRDLSTYARAFNSLKQLLPAAQGVAARSSSAQPSAGARSPAKRSRIERDSSGPSCLTRRRTMLATPSATSEAKDEEAELDCSQLALKLGCVDLADRASRTLKTCLSQDARCDSQVGNSTPQPAGNSRKHRNDGVNWTLYRTASLFAVAQLASAARSSSSGKLREADAHAPVRLNERQLAQQSGVKLGTFNRLVEKLTAIAKSQYGQTESDDAANKSASVPRRRSSQNAAARKSVPRLLSPSQKHENDASAPEPESTDNDHVERDDCLLSDAKSGVSSTQIGPIGNGLFRKQIAKGILFEFDFDPS